MTKHLKYCKHLAHSLAREQVKYCPFRFVSSISVISSKCLGVVSLSTTQDEMVLLELTWKANKLSILGTTGGYQWHQLSKDH